MPALWFSRLFGYGVAILRMALNATGANPGKDGVRGFEIIRLSGIGGA